MLFSVVIPTCHRNDLLALCLDRLAPGKQIGGVLVSNGEPLKDEKLKSEVGEWTTDHETEAESRIEKSEIGEQKAGMRSSISDLRSPISGTHSFTYEVIVTDDGSASTAREMIERVYPWAKWVEGPRRGPAANRNHGASLARGEWLVFTDDDCLPEHDWLYAFHTCHSGNLAIQVLEGCTLPVGVRNGIDEECPSNTEGGHLWSCNFAIEHRVFLMIGCFNETFPSPAMEDVELNTRVNKQALQRAFVNKALVLHPWRRRKGKTFIQSYAQSVRHFAMLHPEKIPQFTANGVELRLLRMFKHSVHSAFRLGTARGLLRQLALDVYAQFCVLREIRRMKDTL
jgi:GT2 family glycosyltransferase